jgi:Secretion system C-terminal sorting domain
MRNQGGMICQNCHGTMEALSNSIENGRRPWLDEPKCGDVTCHGSTYAEEPGKLYRQSKGHGGLYCSSCHGSPHAIYPTSQANDNVQSIRLQNHAGAIDNCMVCHSSPPGGPGPHGIIFIGIIKIGTEVPREFGLDQNYPNPFNPITKIRFHLPSRSFVNLIVHDLTGKEVASLLSSELNAGSYEAEWNGEKFSSGIYFVRMISGTFVMTKKMMLVK